jgi:hypothetical protein
MTEETLQVHERGLQAVLLPRLLKCVFHVTTLEAYALILSSGAIKSNQAGEFCFTFGQSEYSYFRKRACVSVFDLRTVNQDDLDLALHKYYFLNPPFSKDKPVFLFLRESCFEQLIPWSKSKEDEGFSAMVIPHVEAGYPGEIPISLVERVLLVDTERDHRPDPVIDFLVRRASAKKQ